MSTAITPEVVNPSQFPLPAKSHLLFGGLSKREFLFVDYYLADPEGNGTEAARKAGFTGTAESLWTTASRLLRRAKVQAEIRRRLGNHIASSEEVLERLTKQARADLTDVLDQDGNFSLSKARQHRILKKLKVKTTTRRTKDGEEIEDVTQEFEIHDPQAADDRLGRYHKLFQDSTPTTVSLTVNVQHNELTTILQGALGNALDPSVVDGDGPSDGPSPTDTIRK